MERRTRSSGTMNSGRPRRAANQRTREAGRDERQRRRTEDLWDGVRRFSWTRDTESAMYSDGVTDESTGVEIYYCNITGDYYPRKGDYDRMDLEDQERFGDWISIDHNEPFRDYIYNNSTGHGSDISNSEARALYNDTDNLSLVCQSENSSKGDR